MVDSPKKACPENQIPTARYEVTYRRFGLDPNTDGDPSCIGNGDIAQLANTDYWSAVHFLRRLPYEDQRTLLSSMQQQFFGNRSASIGDDLDASVNAAWQRGAGSTDYFQIVGERPQLEGMFEIAGFKLQHTDGNLLAPTRLPDLVLDYFSGDPELALSPESYTVANCLSYAFKNIFPQISAEGRKS